MKVAALKAATVATMAIAAVLGGTSAASADPALPPDGTIPAPVRFPGTGSGPTAQAAFAAALADAQAQAGASGLTDCFVEGDPMITGGVVPGSPVRYVALLTLACTS